jgi:hypothetical protein
MSEMHLTAHSYAALLDRTLPGADARGLAAHLEAGCEACERWLSDRPAADRLDGAVDAALLAIPGPAGGAGSDVEFTRIALALASAPARSVARRRRTAGVAVAVVVALAMAGVAGLLLRTRVPPEWDGLKGAGPPAVPLRLRFLVIHPAPGGPPEIEKGVTGQVVPGEASLQFQVELGREADVVLARAAGDAIEPFFHARLPPGRTVVTVDGQPAVYPLSQLAGRQRFLALAAEQTIEPADIDRAARGADGADAGRFISLELIEVHVR